MLNAAQFSAAKSAAEAKLMQAAVFTEEKKVKSFSEFKKDAEAITDVTQKTWLRVEYESCRRSVVQAERFLSMQADADLYPYWIYRGVMDDREREEHVELEGQVFRIGDPDGDAIYPPDDFNCRCSGEPADDEFLNENNLKANTNAQAKALLDKHVDEQFRYNPANDGPMPSTGSYFDVMGSANEGNAQQFGMGDAAEEGGDTELTGLAAKGLHHLIEIVSQWRQQYHVNKTGDIVFQNDRLLSNVRFTDNALHTIQNHSRGFENIPATIENPDEVWSSWENVNKQRITLRTYIKFGRVSFLVQTRDGVIINSFAVSNKAANKYRKGVII